jgi:hypothetical protein
VNLESAFESAADLIPYNYLWISWVALGAIITLLYVFGEVKYRRRRNHIAMDCFFKDAGLVRTKKVKSRSGKMEKVEVTPDWKYLTRFRFGRLVPMGIRINIKDYSLNREEFLGHRETLGDNIGLSLSANYKMPGKGGSSALSWYAKKKRLLT